MTSVFDGGADTIVEQARTDPMVCAAVARLRTLRYGTDPAQFEALVWLAVAQGACLGARLAIEELQREIVA